MTELHANLAFRRPDFSLEAEFSASVGERVAIVGPNGAGKSTIVRLLAGLEAIDGGRIVLGGRVLDDPKSGIFVAPQDRHLGVTFQRNLLFAHLDTTSNVAFGLRSRGMTRAEAEVSALREMERLGIGSLADRPVDALSGGQQRRVAVARALAGAPALIVLDEPFTGLDATARSELRNLLGAPISSSSVDRSDPPLIMVAHDPFDALAVADRVIVVESGRIVQSGTPAMLRARPASAYVADLVGSNLLRGRADGGTVTMEGTTLQLSVADSAVSGPVLVHVLPQSISLHAEPPGGSPRNAWRATVAGVHDRGMDFFQRNIIFFEFDKRLIH